MNTAAVISPSVTEPATGYVIPEIAIDYNVAMQDVTGAAVGIPDPNSVIVLLLNISDEVLAGVEADSKYYVLWDTPNPKPPNKPPGASEFGQLRAYLAANRWSQSQIDEAIGISPGGRTRIEIADESTRWLYNNSLARAGGID